MNQIKTSEENSLENDWLLIGQLELPGDSISSKALDTWLYGTLGPFDLPPELLSKLKTSVQEAVARIYLPPSQFSQAASLHLFVSQAVKTSRQPNSYWGFFRLEKVDADSENEAPAGHFIEYYLYLER